MKCFLLGQNSHCGLKIPPGEAYEAGLADMSVLGNRQDHRGIRMLGVPLGARVGGSNHSPCLPHRESSISQGHWELPDT